MERSTRDPKRAGITAAILARLHDRLKVEGEFAEPGHTGWRLADARRDLLRELITEFEAMQREAA